MKRLLVPVLLLALSACNDAPPAASGPSTVIDITTANFPQEVQRYNGTVVLDFSAEWCRPCREIAPRFATWSNRHGDKAKFGRIDIDQNASLAQTYGVSTIPTLIVVRNGKETKRWVGPPSEQALLAALR